MLGSSNWKLLIWLILLSKIEIGNGKNAKLGESCKKAGDCVGGHAICNRTLGSCVCSSDYPFAIVTHTGTHCYKATKFGEECLSPEVCKAHDENSACIQEGNIARCGCKLEYKIMYDTTKGKDRCVRQTRLLNSDLVTLLIVGSVMSCFCGLTCLVLRIFARARFGTRRSRSLAAAAAAAAAASPPAFTLSTEQGETSQSMLPQSSRNSSQRSSLAESSRRQSGCLLAPPENSSRRPSNSSIRSNSSTRSQRSYSLKNQLHPSLQHRPSDPESRSGSGRSSLSAPPQDSVGSSASIGQHHSVTFNVSAHSSKEGKKGKRSGSAGTLLV